MEQVARAPNKTPNTLAQTNPVIQQFIVANMRRTIHFCARDHGGHVYRPFYDHDDRVCQLFYAHGRDDHAYRVFHALRMATKYLHQFACSCRHQTLPVPSKFVIWQ